MAKEKKDIEKLRQANRDKLIVENQKLRVKAHETSEARKAQIEHLRKTADKHFAKAEILEGPLRDKWNRVGKIFLQKAEQIEKSL